MINRFSCIIGLLVLVVAVSGCTMSAMPVQNEIRLNEIDFSKINKTGEACTTFILQVFGPFGDQSIKRAVDNGKLSRVDLVEYKVNNYLIANQQCVKVYGH